MSSLLKDTVDTMRARDELHKLMHRCGASKRTIHYCCRTLSRSECHLWIGEEDKGYQLLSFTSVASKISDPLVKKMYQLTSLLARKGCVEWLHSQFMLINFKVCCLQVYKGNKHSKSARDFPCEWLLKCSHSIVNLHVNITAMHWHNHSSSFKHG